MDVVKMNILYFEVDIHKTDYFDKVETRPDIKNLLDH